MRSEPHLTAEKLLSRLGVEPGALGKIALVPGPRERAAKLRRALREPRRTLAFQDYEMHTGALGARRVTVGNGGRYSADTAITTELLCAGGVDTLVRVGSCGSLQHTVKLGDIVIATGAVRGDGASPRYVPEGSVPTDFAAARTPNQHATLPHPRVVEALARAADSLKAPVHHGRVYTTDALFRETPELLADLERRQITAIDMVTAAFLTVAQFRNAKAGAILAVSDECLTGRLGFRHPSFLEAEERIGEIALKAVQWL